MIEPTRVALVLAGGVARGPYEVGVVRYILGDVARSLGHDVPIDILSGASIGAINCCQLAAFADEPRLRAERLVGHWTALRPEQVLRPNYAEGLALARRALGLGAAPATQLFRGLIDSSPLERIVRAAIPFPRIAEHIAAGRLTAVAVAATHVASGKTRVFVQHGTALPARWECERTVEGRSQPLSPAHVLASASIPLLFPPVPIDGEYHCDGGLRYNVPLAPARRLGATHLVVVTAQTAGSEVSSEQARARERAFTNPFFLVGKTLSALMLDRLDSDLGRQDKINRILESGTRLYGDTFLGELNKELGGVRRLRPLDTLLIRATEDPSRIALEVVRDPTFARRVPGIVGRAFRRLADEEGDADLLSYILFDGEYARRLIELGMADARARHEELCGFFARAIRRRIENPG